MNILKTSLIVLVFALGTLAQSSAAATSRPKTNYEVATFNGQQVVLISLELAEKIHALVSRQTDKEHRLAEIRALVAQEGQLHEDGSPSYCSTAAEVYASVNSDAKALAERCAKRMASDDAVDSLPDESRSVDELRLTLSAYFKILITFNF